ncbi:MAG: hypothetical protein IKL65_03380 [Bacilli bacterium]|nr:hypothetical protein [Bacilli bacterium]
MYEERKEKFSFKSFFLTLLLVLLFVFLMLWLFPTRNYVDEKLQSTYDLERLSVLYDEIFANNVGRMKDAAIGYFTNERMPKTVGETKKLTLQEMYDLHLVLKMKDKDGKPCDTEKSYVEMTKYTEEYRLKVNLSCGTQEDYIIVYLGCYNYCASGICEKRVPTPSQTTAKEEETTNNPTPSKPTPDKPTPEDPEPDNPIITKYLYEYKLVVNDSKTCGNWTSWQKEEVKATDLVKVETKTEKEFAGYKTIKVPVTKTETVTKKVNERYISKYITELVMTGTKDVQTGTTTKTVTEKVKVGTVEVDTGKIGTGTAVPKNTSTTVYKKISEDTPTSCSYCENETIYTWKIYKIEPVYEVQEVTKEVPVYKTIKVYETKEVPVYSYRTIEKQEEVEKTTYEEKKIKQYKNVTYYRSLTCKINKGYTDIKWSKSKVDADLVGKGYKLTGNVKKV